MSTSGADVTAEQVVVAAGYEHTPFVPDWPGRERFRGSLLHAAEYRNPEPYRGRDVLVVGPGCSGMEIAYDLAEGGARRVRLAVRTPPNMLVRSPIGPAFALVLLAPATAARRPDRQLRAAPRRSATSPSTACPCPRRASFSRLHRLGVAPAIIDKPVVQAIRDRRIEIVAGVESLDETGVGLADGARIEPDVVIAATGYRRGLEPMVGHLGVLDDEGVPRAFAARRRRPACASSATCHLPAQLRYAGREAKRAANAIAGELHSQMHGSPAVPAIAT